MRSSAPTLTVLIKGGPLTKGRVTARKIVSKLNAVVRGLGKCSDLVKSQEPRDRGRRGPISSQLSELYLTALHFDSFQAEFELGDPSLDLFSQQRSTAIAEKFFELSEAIVQGQMDEVLRKYVTPSRYVSLARPFVDLLPSQEDDTELLIKHDGAVLIFDSTAAQRSSEFRAYINSAKDRGRMIGVGTFRINEVGHVIGLDTKEIAALLVDSPEANVNWMSASIFRLRTARSETGVIEFNEDIPVTITKYSDHYEAVELHTGISSLGETEDEARAALEDMLISLYFEYKALPRDNLTARAARLRDRLINLVQTARED